ncbi:MAG: hypothetical protein ACMUIP_15030 [bacterium]
MNKKMYKLYIILFLSFFLMKCSGGSGTDGVSVCSSDYHSQLGVTLEEVRSNPALLFSDGNPLASTTVCDACHSAEGDFDGVNDPNFGAKNIVLSEDGSPYDSEGLLKASCAKWCAGCHDDEPSVISHPCLTGAVTAPNIAGEKDWGLGFYETGHGLSPDSYYMDSNRAGAGIMCTACHDSSLSHLGIATYSAELGNYTEAYRLKSVDGGAPLVIPRTNNQYFNTDFRLCYSCHNESAIIGQILDDYRYYSGAEPYVNINARYVSQVKTKFRNVRAEGGNEHDAVQGDFTDRSLGLYYPINSHWSHLALANRDVELEPLGGGGGGGAATRQVRCSEGSGCHEPLLWDSDHDFVNEMDSRISCPSCHNPHGTNYPAMTHNDLAITHVYPEGSPEGGPDWEYGYIGSPEYGKRDITNYHDLYCNECHGRDLNDEISKIGYGEDFRYYPNP